MRTASVGRLRGRELTLPGRVVCAAVAVLMAALERPNGLSFGHDSIALGQSSLAGPEQADLADLFSQFQSVSSLHFSASVSISLIPVEGECDCNLIRVPGEAIFGHVGYWAADDRYRISSHVDPDRFPGMQTDIAYDGRRFQLLRSDGTLSYSGHDSAVILPVLPNPLLDLVQFRYPLTDENYQFAPRLKDVRNDRPPTGFFDVPWVSVDDGGRSLERAIFPGGTYEGRSYVHQVYALPGQRHTPARIERVTEDGVMMTSAEFTDYCQLDTPSGPTYWPQEVVLRAFDSQGNEVVKMSFVLSTIEVDAEIPEEVFVISTQAAARVWDDDRREFVTP